MVKTRKGIKMLMFFTKDPYHFGKIINSGIEDMPMNGRRKQKQNQHTNDRAPLEARIQHFFEAMRDAEDGNYTSEPESEVHISDMCDYFKQIFDEVIYDGTTTEQK